jgi:NAD(P)H-nitrite reductase large subunit
MQLATAGDTRHYVWRTLPNGSLASAVEQGKVAALNMLGINAIYEGTLSQNVIDIFNMSFASIGSLNGEKINISKHGALNRFTIKKGKIIGAQMVGDIDNAGIISSYIKKGIDAKDLEYLKLISSGKLRFNDSPLFRQYLKSDNVKGPVYDPEEVA